jgi:hypothetical protein
MNTSLVGDLRRCPLRKSPAAGGRGARIFAGRNADAQAKKMKSSPNLYVDVHVPVPAGTVTVRMSRVIDDCGIAVAYDLHSSLCLP